LIIGDGNVGSALARGLERAGHAVSTTGHDPERVKQLAAEGEVVILAIPFHAHDEVASATRDAVADKPVVDVSNAVSPQFTLVFDYAASAAEELQKNCRRPKW
jgi:8-hydroxy-5-deazaflavin:NADPH oxidoreductase